MQGDDVGKRDLESSFSEIVIDDDSKNSEELPLVRVPQTRQKKQKQPVHESSPDDDDDEVIYVPDNPKTWSARDIEKWIKWASKSFDIPPLDASRFPKDAKTMTKFSKADFFIVCGSFEGGRKLSQYYGYLMQKVSETFDPSLLSDDDPGKTITFYGGARRGSDVST